MSTAFFPPTAVGLPTDEIQIHGNPVSVIACYPTLGGMRLHSLAMATTYRCGICRQSRESAMVAVGEQSLVCPSCFARLARAPAVDIPEQRGTRAN